MRLNSTESIVISNKFEHTHTRHTRARGIQIVYVFDLSRIEAISYSTIQCNSRPNRHLATLLLLFYLDFFFILSLALFMVGVVWRFSF